MYNYYATGFLFVNSDSGVSDKSRNAAVRHSGMYENGRTVFSALCRLACQAQIVGIKLCKVPGKRHGAGTDLAGFYFVCLRKRRNCSAAGENVWSFFHASTVPVSSLGDSGTKVRASEMLSRSKHSAAPMPFFTMLEAFRIRLYVAAISSFS